MRTVKDIKNGFEFLPHTADTRMRVWGRTLKELFRNALLGLVFYIKPDVLKSSGKPSEKQKIKIEAVDITSLLVEFLSQVVALSDIHNSVFTKIVFRELGDNFLEGEIQGIAVGGFDKEIKAVSYHEVDVRKDSQTGLYETMLVFDI